MKLTLRMKEYHWDTDFERCRKFLGDIFPIRKSYTNWIPSQLENVKYGPGGPEYLDEEEDYLKIGELEEGQESTGKVIAISFTEPSGECYLSIHPNQMMYAKEIVSWMMNKVRELKSESTDEIILKLFVDDDDEELTSCLAKMEFQKGEMYGDKQVRPLDAPIPEYELPEGYTVRNARIIEEWEKYREVEKAVFPHVKDMTFEQLELYSKATFYHPEMDIVAVDPDGVFAAFCTVRMDDESKIAELEPVGTHPDYRKLGLAKAVICEGLKRLEKHNPSAVVIIGAAPSEGARKLYESVGFVNEGTVSFWRKTI